MCNRQLSQMTTICQFLHDTQREALLNMRSWKQTICCRSCGCMALPSPFQVRIMLLLWAGENFSITVKFSELEIGCKAANQIPKCMSLQIYTHIFILLNLCTQSTKSITTSTPNFHLQLCVSHPTQSVNCSQSPTRKHEKVEYLRREQLKCHHLGQSESVHFFKLGPVQTIVSCRNLHDQNHF